MMRWLATVFRAKMICFLATMITCDRCKTENLDGSQYCDECGAPLRPNRDLFVQIVIVQSTKDRTLPIIVLLTAVLIWIAVSLLRVFPESVFPSPMAVIHGFFEELHSGGMVDDIVASL